MPPRMGVLSSLAVARRPLLVCLATYQDPFHHLWLVYQDT
jgi:hypothetical protein